MGGPGASVLLRDPLTKPQVDELDVWLHSITSTLEGDAPNGYSFWLKEDAFPGTVSQCLFYLELDNPENLAEEEERQQLIEHLGYFPQQAIGVSSGCNQDSDHSTLGRLILHLAEFYHGLIDMSGAITPPVQPIPVSKDFFTKQLAIAEERKAYLRAQWDALRPHSHLEQHCMT